MFSFHVPGEFLDLHNLLFDVADHNVQSLTRSVVAQVNKRTLLHLIDERIDVRRAI